MSEQSVFTSRAVVYVVDPATRGWVASAVTGFTRLDIYVHSGTGAARVIGRSQEDPNKISINSNITKDIVYTKARDTFHQWSDARGAFGLNFSTAQEADAFAVAFENAKGGGASKPPAAAPPAAPTPAAPKPAPPSAPAPKPPAPSAPSAPSGGPPAPPSKAPPPPAPPKAPPKPPAAPAAPTPSGDAPPERNALLNSIQGFSKNGLKKTVTVDKSAPIVSNKPGAPAPAGAGAAAGGGNSLTRKEAASASTPAPSGGGGGAFGGGDMMAEILRKRNAMANKTAEPAAPKPAASKPAPPTPAATAKPITPTGKQPPPPSTLKPSTPSATVVHTPSFGSSSSASSSELPEHLQILKEQILAEVRAELAQLKADLIQSLQH